MTSTNTNTKIARLLEEARLIKLEIKKAPKKHNAREIASAVACFDKAISLDPKNTLLQLKKAAFLHEFRQFQASVDMAVGVINLINSSPTPTNREHVVIALVVCGEGLMQSGMEEDGVRAMRGAVTEALALASNTIPAEPRVGVQEHRKKLRAAEDRIKLLEAELQNGLVEMEKLSAQALASKPDPEQGAKISSLENDLQQAHSKISALECELQTQKTEHDVAHQQDLHRISLLESQVEDLKANHDSNTHENANILSEVSQQLSDANEKFANANKQLELERICVQNLRQEIEELRKLQTDNDNDNNSRNDSATAEKETAEMVAQLTHELENLRTESAKEITALNQQILQLDSNLKTTLKERDETQQQMQKISAEFSVCESEIRLLTKERNGLLELTQTSKFKIETLEKNIIAVREEKELAVKERIEIETQQSDHLKVIDELRAQLDKNQLDELTRLRAKEKRLELENLRLRGELGLNRRSHIGPPTAEKNNTTNNDDDNNNATTSLSSLSSFSSSGSITTNNNSNNNHGSNLSGKRFMQPTIAFSAYESTRGSRGNSSPSEMESWGGGAGGRKRGEPSFLSIATVRPKSGDSD